MFGILKALDRRIDQVEGVVQFLLTNHQAQLKALEDTLAKQFAADLAAQKLLLVQQFNTAIATLEQRIQLLQQQAAVKTGSVVRSEDGQAELYNAKVDRPVVSNKVPH